MKVRFQADADFNQTIVLAPQHLPPSGTVEELLLIWAASDAEEWANRIVYLPL